MFTHDQGYVKGTVSILYWYGVPVGHLKYWSKDGKWQAKFNKEDKFHPFYSGYSTKRKDTVSNSINSLHELMSCLEYKELFEFAYDNRANQKGMYLYALDTLSKRS